MSALTFYRNDGMAANHHTYRQNLHHYGAVCASSHWPLGTRLTLTTRDGRHVRLTVCDRVGHGTDIDVDPATFVRLEGGLRKGRGRVRVRVTQRPHKRRRPRKGLSFKAAGKSRRHGGQT